MMLERLIKHRNSKSAYVVNGETISYDELFEKAKYYGDLLKRQGDAPIIVYGHKSIDMFVSIFACLEAQRPYIPVDIFTPAERIKKIAAATKCSLIIANEALEADGIECLKLCDLKKYESNAHFEYENDIAYIIFTSGSTGEPKGVPISYKNLLNFIGWINTVSPLCEYQNINVLNQASFSFDLSVADIFYSVSNSHTLIALDKDSQGDYNRLFDVLNSNCVNVVVATPTFIKLCMTNIEFNEKNFSSLKCFYFCGEQLEPSTVKKIFLRFPNARIINAYGPTEAASAVSAVEITEEMTYEALLPIGEVRKFATDICIIDDEIVLKGDSVFGGYINGFEGGFFKENNINCYKTGDIGFIKDGKLYCKGRKDAQIKYKGYRIELTDIEANILSIEGVKDCAVTAKRQNSFNVKMIKAFVVLNDGYSTEYVKEQLKQKLPLYMIPKIIKQISEMPISCNGKKDRRRLNEL